MKRIGITGGMGCGKSTVVAEFQQLGIPCFVADTVAAAYYNDPGFLKQVADMLGEKVTRGDGRADKQRIADIVFANPDKLHQLNSLVHPRVMHDFDRFCHQNDAHPYVLFESAILYDYGLDKQMDAVICVYLDLEERIQRLLARDHLTHKQLMDRINRQLPAEQVMMRANYVILNYEGNPRHRQVAYIDKQLKQ